MKKHNEAVHAHDSSRHYNRVIGKIDRILMLLQDEDWLGETLGETLENLIALIQANADDIVTVFPKIDKFITNYADYNLEDYTNKSFAQVLVDKISAETFADGVKTRIASASITNKTKFAKIATQIQSTLEYVTPTSLDRETLRLIQMNDCLDAASYCARNIDYNNGNPRTWTEEQRRQKIRALAETALRRYDSVVFPQDMQADADELKAAAEYVLTIVDTETLESIATWIDANVEKVPLMRRIWAD